MTQTNNDTTGLLTGNEEFSLNGENMGFNVLDFWRFQYSNLSDLEGRVGEFLVAMALGKEYGDNNNGFTLWDINYRGKRIEVKTTSYYKTWRKEGTYSEVRTFGIQQTYPNKDGNPNTYSDNKEEVKRGGLRNWLLNTISVSNLLLDSQSIKDRILLEDVPSGQGDLALILEAMKTNTQLRITYQSYWRDESFTFNVHPYCVKLFKQRWYLIALSPNLDRIMVYALDRIYDICKLDGETFTMPDDFYPEDFFYDYYGIIAGTNRKPEKVKLKVSAGQANYLRSLPLHDTQEEIEENEEYSIFTLRERSLQHLHPSHLSRVRLLSGDSVEW